MAETDQTAFWRGAFGAEYVARNTLDPVSLSRRTAMWARVLQPIGAAPPASVLEIGANIGINIAALRSLLAAELHAVEPNPVARATLASSGLLPAAHVHDAVGDSLPLSDDAVDLAFTCGVLIHVAPERLEATCREMYRVSRRYIACIEYFATTPEERLYRGHAGKLFKRDFGSYWWDLYPRMRLVDHGFFWRRTSGLDDLTWWLFEKP
jgi:pseudaminic acid biosynthesis-associated methylase